ncbi:MAG: hypothetical protein WBB22_05765 [Anaerolineae bacterium]
MAEYKLFMVGTAKIKAGKVPEAARWWRERGLPDLRSRPWAKSVKSYAVQFGLGGEYEMETWVEIDDYAAMDVMDNWIIEDPERAEKDRNMWKEANEYYEWGPVRLMGDWPESALVPE